MTYDGAKQLLYRYAVNESSNRTPCFDLTWFPIHVVEWPNYSVQEDVVPAYCSGSSTPLVAIGKECRGKTGKIPSPATTRASAQIKSMRRALRFVLAVMPAPQYILRVSWELCLRSRQYQ